MIRRSFDHKFIESVICHPSVIGGAKAWVGIDLREIILNPKNYLLINEYGGFLVINRLPGIYECHTQFLPDGRGEQVIKAVKEAMDYMYVHTDCEKIITRAYKDNSASIKLSKLFFTEMGETDDYYYYRQTYSDWLINDLNAAEGESFHATVEGNTNHEDDKAHDFHVGYAIRLCKSGNAIKAQKIYNEWAVMSGYEPLVILSFNPLVAKAGDMLLEFINGEVSLCQ